MSLIDSFSQIGQSFLKQNPAAGMPQDPLRALTGSLDLPGSLEGLKDSALVRKAEESLGALMDKAGTVQSPAGTANSDGAPRLQAGDPRFGNLLRDIVNEVEAADRTAGASVQGLLLGESDNLHQAMVSLNEASTAFTLMVQVRNKLVEAYQEVMRMQI